MCLFQNEVISKLLCWISSGFSKMNKTESQKALYQLGLPPMELAEPNTNDKNAIPLKKCISPMIHRTITTILLICLAIASYVILINQLQRLEESRNIEIVIITGSSESSNVTTAQETVEVYAVLKNTSSHSDTIRIKRDVKEPVHTDLDENDIKNVREVVMNDESECENGKENDICKELVDKIAVLSNNKDSEIIYEVTNDITSKININELNESEEKSGSKKGVEAEPTSNTRVTRSTLSLPTETKDSHFDVHDHYVHNVNPYPQVLAAPPLTDTCLLARLLKENHAHMQGYPSPIAPFIPSHYDGNPLGYGDSRYLPHEIPLSYVKARENDLANRKLHPQDIDIVTSFMSTRPPDHQTNSSTREVQCESGTLPCSNSDECVSEKKWCDGRVDCSDSSDESSCSCRSRVDQFRLCDGYSDCPFGEDEMGCYGCGESMFSCEDLDINSHSTCFTKEQRCNNIADCPNHKDETDCTMLAPSLHTKPIFAISNTEGYLHRNFRGDWYAVCQNPYMWAHDACRRETGLIIRPPFIQLIPIDPTQRVNYINTGPAGELHTSNTCFNTSAVYVTCPDLLCGTRVLSTSQLLKENIMLENRLFGRNKRYLLRNRQAHLYPTMLYRNRRKRFTGNEVNKERYRSDSLNVGSENTIRTKRTEGKVVGGSPSQPAAWPWMIAMYRDGIFHCGGVVLSQSWTISAAHCVTKFWEHYYEVKVGMLRRFSFSPQEQNHQVTHVIVNQNYDQVNMKNDLSLLKVKSAIQFSRWVRPICLPGPETAGPDWLWGPAAGTRCTAVGWGATVEQGNDPDQMREVEMPVWKNCKHEEDRAGKEICAGFVEGGKDTCQGDSGGPLLCKNPFNPQQWYMAGIVSHGNGCAEKDEPGAYTRVSIFVKWIKYHTSSKSLPIIQPKQECPGFKCTSGILKCLPYKRMCDKIVDCLGGEDETNCEFTRSTHTFGDTFLSETSKDITNLIIGDREAKETEDKNIVSEQEEQSNALKIPEIAVNERKPEYVPSSTNLIVTETVPLHTETIDDLQNIDSSDESSFEDSNEKKPATVVTRNVTRGDMLTTEVSISKQDLESISSVEPKKYPKVADIDDNWSDDVPNISLQEETRTEPSTTALFEVKRKTEQMPESSTDLSSETTINDEHSSTEAQDQTTDEDSKQFEADSLDSDEKIQSEPSTVNKITVPSNIDENKSISLEDTINENREIVNMITTESVSSNLRPANIRKKHRIPEEFQCRRIFQMIPHSLRCDRKADCEDGTDELSCSCVDYIYQSNHNLICNGQIDCADGLDEIDCFKCPENHFLCKRSQLCLPSEFVCDGKGQCPQEEDELNCFALSNGKNIILDVDGRPGITLEGYLTRKHKNHWHIMCDDNFSRDQQEQAADNICRYLGFSSANRYFVKHVNVKADEMLDARDESRGRREIHQEEPVHFTYRKRNDDEEEQQVIIKEPEILKEKCVPNVTKTCMSLYVFCDHSLFTDFNLLNEVFFSRAVDNPEKQMWPWIAKVYADGVYKCTGVLIDLTWVLISQSCLWDTLLEHNFVIVSLGSHQTIDSSNGMYEQIYQVDAKKDSHHSKTTLLHLKNPAEYTTMVKPMMIHSSQMHDEKPSVCVAVGQDENNNTVSVFLQETNENCNLHSLCYVRMDNDNICTPGAELHRQWAGIVSCHADRGWYPAASFVDSRAECGMGNKIIATEIHSLKKEIMKFFKGRANPSSVEEGEGGICEGARCSRGRCVGLRQICDGIGDCEDLNDESDEACEMKTKLCSKEPYHPGCECTSGQFKCHNGKCVAKELFRDGRDDCGDATDEPTQTTCAHYLAKAKPSRLCDGILHCQDRSDEDPMFCKCFAKGTYKCKNSNDVELCVARDMLCDGHRDCPNGDDEETCIALRMPQGSPHGTGQVVIRSHGVWYSKCYLMQNHTRSQLEDICREVGFISGHARQLWNPPPPFVPLDLNEVKIHQFDTIVLNNFTTIHLRNSDEPIAKPVHAENIENCFPVYIECL